MVSTISNIIFARTRPYKNIINVEKNIALPKIKKCSTKKISFLLRTIDHSPSKCKYKCSNCLYNYALDVELSIFLTISISLTFPTHSHTFSSSKISSNICLQFGFSSFKKSSVVSSQSRSNGHSLQ